MHGAKVKIFSHICKNHFPEKSRYERTTFTNLKARKWSVWTPSISFPLLLQKMNFQISTATQHLMREIGFLD